MFTHEEYTKQFLEHLKEMEKLEIIVFERTAELLLYKALIKERGLEKEFKQRIKQAKEMVDASEIR